MCGGIFYIISYIADCNEATWHDAVIVQVMCMTIYTQLQCCMSILLVLTLDVLTVSSHQANYFPIDVFWIDAKSSSV